MSLTNIKNVDNFFELINSCEGDVYLTSKEGDMLNLKSTLTQFVARDIFFGDILELEIVTHNPDDKAKIMKFMMEE